MILEQELRSRVDKIGVGIVSISTGWHHFISFHCTATCRQPGLSRGYIDFPKFGTDKQTDGQTDKQTAVFVELLRN
jgi:hypothetical protein